MSQFEMFKDLQSLPGKTLVAEFWFNRTKQQAEVANWYIADTETGKPLNMASIPYAKFMPVVEEMDELINDYLKDNALEIEESYFTSKQR